MLMIGGGSMEIKDMNVNKQVNEKIFRSSAWVKGVTFTFLIALFGYLLAMIPGFSHIGQLACAMIIAVFYRQIFGFPTTIQSGIEFSSKRLLRLAIILYGLKLNIATVLDDGLGLLLRDAGVIIFAIFSTIWLAKVLKADKVISLLLGVGTGVCGAAAIAAIAPIIKSKDEDTAISVGIIALMGTIFAIGYTILRPILPFDAISYGIWAGTSLHEVAHVALAGAPAGDDGLAIALLAKLGRVFLLVPLCFIFMYTVKRKNKGKDADTTIEFPWFLVGFIIVSMLGSYIFGHSIPVSKEVMDAVFSFTTWLLTAAMVGLGLKVSLRDLRTRALRPLVAMTITSGALSILVYFVV